MSIKNIRKKVRKKTKKTPTSELHLFWLQNKEKFKIKDLVYIVREIDYLWLKKGALREFLTRDNLNFDNFYRMFDAAKYILEKDKDLKSQFLKECFAICTEHNLVELGEAGEPEAIKELFHRIEKGSISNRKAIQVLIRFFEITTEPQATSKNDYLEKNKKAWSK